MKITQKISYDHFTRLPGEAINLVEISIDDKKVDMMMLNSNGYKYKFDYDIFDKHVQSLILRDLRAFALPIATCNELIEKIMTEIMEKPIEKENWKKIAAANREIVLAYALDYDLLGLDCENFFVRFEAYQVYADEFVKRNPHVDLVRLTRNLSDHSTGLSNEYKKFSWLLNDFTEWYEQN